MKMGCQHVSTVLPRSDQVRVFVRLRLWRFIAHALVLTVGGNFLHPSRFVTDLEGPRMARVKIVTLEMLLGEEMCLEFIHLNYV